MAKVTGDGRVLSSGPGLKGTRTSWTLLDIWVSSILKRRADQLRATRGRRER